MSFETFRVELQCGPATHAQVVGTIRRLPHARPDPDAIPSRGSAYFTVEDGLHVFEIEVADSPVRVSCRFTLCHPPSVDAAFLGLVRGLQARLGMAARVCDDVSPDRARYFAAAEFSGFAGVARDAIATRRAEWIAQFGSRQLAAKTSDVYETFILPLCAPVAG